MEALADATLVFLLLGDHLLLDGEEGAPGGPGRARVSPRQSGLPAGLLAVAALFVWIKSSVQWAWSAARLAPALGILHGL
jgi:hypothetical protein